MDTHSCVVDLCEERVLHKVSSDRHPLFVHSCTKHLPLAVEEVKVHWRSRITVALIVSALVTVDREDWRTSLFYA